jgi:RimJ/RimL family protein N-acetyltransferase
MSVVATTDLARVEGPRLALRLATPDDAAYVFGLRNDPRYNAHLSPVVGGVEDQRAWLTRYKTREAEGEEFYYVIERRRDATPCGLVRLYDVTPDSFTWGSWILDENKPPKAALESTMLSFGVGFERLGAARALLDVRRANVHAEAFYRRLGVREIGADSENFYFDYAASQFEKDKPRHMAVLLEGGDT